MDWNGGMDYGINNFTLFFPLCQTSEESLIAGKCAAKLIG